MYIEKKFRFLTFSPMNLHSHFRALECHFETILPIFALLVGVVSSNFSHFRLFLVVSG